ncbi:MAG: peptidoglycan-binding protein [Patescibacteria group bacterium]
MSKLTSKILSVGLSITTMVWLAGSVVPVSAQSVDINALLAQIQALQQQIAALQGNSGTPASSYTFTRDLTVGSKGADVTALQQTLISGGYLKVAAPTAFFGSLTKAALAAWQAAKGVTPSVGYFGPKTRAAFVGTATGGTGGIPPVVIVPSGTDLVASLAVDTPAARTIGSGTAFNPALKVNLTAGSKAVNVTGVTLQKSGFVANTSLNGVDVIDAMGVRHGNVITSINADNTIGITFPSSPIMVAAGQSTSFTVRFNLVTGSITGTVAFNINSASAIMADTTSIGGSYPIVGNGMNIVSGASALASTTLDVLTSTGSSSLSVDPVSQQEITKFQVRETSSNEGVNFSALTLYNYGNAGAGDYADVQLLDQSGNILATAQPMGQYVNFTITPAYFIDKGLTKNFTVKAKLIGGTTKTINLVVYNNYDINLMGVTTGVSVIPGAAATNDSAFPIGNGFNIQTIGTGTATLTRTIDSPSAAVTPSANNVLLAKYNFRPSGENMEVRQVSFYIATSTAAAKTLTGTVYVKFNGAIVYSTGGSNVSPITAATFTLSSYPVATQGVDNFITVETSIPSTATAVDSYQVKSFDIIQAKRLVTNDLVDPTVAATDGLALSVKAAALTVTTLASLPLAGQSVVVGTNDYVFATITLNSSAGGEDVNVTTVKVSDSSSDSNYTGITSLVMYKGNPVSGGTVLSTTASTATNGATTNFNFSSPIVVNRATPITLYLVANVASSTSANVTHTFNVASSTSAITAVGVTTGNSLTNGTDISFAGSGQAQTIVTSGSLNMNLVTGAGATPSNNQTVSVGATQGTWFAVRLSSANETQKITSLKLTATSSGSTGLTTTTLRNITLSGDLVPAGLTKGQFDTCIAGECVVTFPSVGGTSDNILTAPVPVSGTTIYVKADVGVGTIDDLGNSFAFVIASSTHVTVKGSVSGLTTGTVTGQPGISTGASTVVSTGYSFVVPQSVVVTGVSPTVATKIIGLTSGQTVATFKITNNGATPIYLSTSTTGMTFYNSGAGTTTATSSAYTLYASQMSNSSADITYSTSTWATSLGSSSVPFGYTISASEANRTILGGSSRYLIIKTNVAADNGNTFKFSIQTIGNLLYYVKGSDLYGYPSNPTNSASVPTGLYIDGVIPGIMPSVEVTTLSSS